MLPNWSSKAWFAKVDYMTQQPAGIVKIPACLFIYSRKSHDYEDIE